MLDTLQVPRTEFDPFTRETIPDSTRLLTQLLAPQPFVYLERYGVYATGRHEIGQKMLRDWKSFTSTVKAWGPREHIPLVLVAEDPPLHTGSRNAMMEFFAPLALATYKETFEAYAERISDELIAKGVVDGTEDVGASFVLQAFPDILGMQPLNRERLLAFGDLAFNSTVPVNEIYHECKARSGDVLEWFSAQFEREAVVPGKLADRIYGLGDRGLVPPDVAAQLVRAVFSAGFDTTVLSIGTGLKLLAENPDQWDLLRADPTLIKNAFEETIRFDPPSRVLGRGVNEDMEFFGLDLKAGDRVAVFLNAAGRDPAKWDNPDRFDITRKGIAGHMSFGIGIHACLGQALARLEFGAIVGALARKVRRLELAGEPVRKINNRACGWDHVPLRLVV